MRQQCQDWEGRAVVREAVEGYRQELGLERAAHRETRAYLQRALRAAQYWRAEADRLERGDPNPTPNPMPIPNGPPNPSPPPFSGGGGDDAVVVLCAELCGTLTRLLAEVVRGAPHPPKTDGPDRRLTLLRARMRRLAAAREPDRGSAEGRDTEGGGGPTHTQAPPE